MRTYKMLAAGLLLGLALPGAGRADDPVKEPEKPPVESREGQDKQLDRLTGEFGATREQVQEMRDSGMGWGEIGHALAIAQKSGKPLADVLALRDSGMGWGEIAKSYGFKLGEVRGKARRFAREAPKSDPDLRDAPKQEEPKDEDKLGDKDGDREGDRDGDKKQVDRLTKEFGVTDKQVTDLRDDGYGWGEIRHALAISRKAGVPLSEVTALRDDGKGWGQIAKSYGFSLGDVTGKGKAPETGKKDSPPARDQGKGREFGHSHNDGGGRNNPHAPHGGPKR